MTDLHEVHYQGGSFHVLYQRSGWIRSSIKLVSDKKKLTRVMEEKKLVRRKKGKWNQAEVNDSPTR